MSNFRETVLTKCAELGMTADQAAEAIERYCDKLDQKRAAAGDAKSDGPSVGGIADIAGIATGGTTGYLTNNRLGNQVASWQDNSSRIQERIQRLTRKLQSELKYLPTGEDAQHGIGYNLYPGVKRKINQIRQKFDPHNFRAEAQKILEPVTSKMDYSREAKALRKATGALDVHGLVTRKAQELMEAARGAAYSSEYGNRAATVNSRLAKLTPLLDSGHMARKWGPLAAKSVPGVAIGAGLGVAGLVRHLVNKGTQSFSGLPKKAALDPSLLWNNPITSAASSAASYWPYAFAIPPVLGAAAGYGLAKATDIDDTTVKEIQRQEQISELRRQRKLLARKRRLYLQQ